MYKINKLKLNLCTHKFLGCTPSEVFYGRVCNGEFHPLLVDITDSRESEEESTINQQALQQESEEKKGSSVENHLKVTKYVHSLASMNSKVSAQKMVSSAKAKHLPARYHVGCEVLVRRFSSKSQKKEGRGLVRRQVRVVKGTVIQAKASKNQYKVRYNLNGTLEEKWYTVADVTSLTHEDEKKMHGQGR